MATKTIALTGLFLLGFLVTPARSGEIDPSLGCANNPAVVGACFAIKGRVRVYDGSPSVRVWPKGSHRLLGVLPSEREIMPDDLKKAISPGTDAFAQMTVCPFTPQETGKMQFVCIESAHDIRPVHR
jgi:hypothetical protein